MSHDNLTSPRALAALRELPETNPHLHHQLNGLNNLDDLPTVNPGDEEPDFGEEIEDDCDVPTEVLASHVASGLTGMVGGFKVGDDGRIERNAMVEDTEVEQVKVEVEVEQQQGRGCRKKFAKRPFGSVGEWERD